MSFLKRLFFRPKQEPVALGLPYDAYPEVYLVFGENPKVYGPYPLKDAAEFKSFNNSPIRGCFSGQETWRPQQEILNVWLSATPSSRTNKQLENAGLIAATEIEGLGVLKAYRESLGPTKRQQEQLKEAGIPEPGTRAEANALLKDYRAKQRKKEAAKEKKERIQKLIAEGFPIEQPISEEDLDLWEETGMPTEKQLARLERDLAKIRSLGIDYEPPKNLSKGKISEVIDLLDEAASEIEALFEPDFADLSREPTAEERAAIARYVFRRIQKETWDGIYDHGKAAFRKGAPGIKVEVF